MRILNAILLTVCVAAGTPHPVRAEKLTVDLTYLGFDRASPFHGQLLLQVTNESFMSVDLLEKIRSAQLYLDGHPISRLDKPFGGPAGLAPKGSWEGCLSLEDFFPGTIEPGIHQLQLKLGESLSRPIRFKAKGAADTAASTNERLQQAEVLKSVITPGLLRSCVENWLTEQDGGMQTRERVHYYVDPGVKVLVSYKDAQPEQRVTGRIKIYVENRILD